MEVNFAIYREKLITDGWPGAIIDATLDRAIGLGQYENVTFWLVDCDDKLFTYARRKLSRHNVKIERTTLRAVSSHISAGSWVITHDWFGKLYALMEALENVNWLVTLDIVPLYDRLSSTSFVGRVLTSEPAFRALTYKWRRYLSKAKILVAVSDREARILKDVYKVSVHAVIPAPISVELKNTLKLHYLLLIDVKPRDVPVIRKIVSAFRPGRVIAKDNMDSSILSSIGYPNAEILKNTLPREELLGLMAAADLVVLSERAGTFEMMPLEIIAAGTPVVTPTVPSVEMLRRYAGDAAIGEIPFLDLDMAGSLDVPGLQKWFSAAQRSIDDSRLVIEDQFSMKSVGHQLYQLITKEAGNG